MDLSYKVVSHNTFSKLTAFVFLQLYALYGLNRQVKKCYNDDDKNNDELPQSTIKNTMNAFLVRRDSAAGLIFIVFALTVISIEATTKTSL